MDWLTEDLARTFKDLLRSVAVMNVPVNDHDALKPSAPRLGRLDGPRRRDRHGVYQPETHRAAALRVVAGRPHDAGRAVDVATEHGLRRGDGAAGCEQRRVDRVFVHEYIVVLRRLPDDVDRARARAQLVRLSQTIKLLKATMRVGVHMLLQLDVATAVFVSNKRKL